MARPPMSDKEQTSFRVGEQTHGIVRTEVVEHTEHLDSAKEFYETSVQGSVRTLQKLGAGGKQARDLIFLLNEIRGISVSIPEDEASATIFSGELSEIRPRIELTPDKLEALSTLKLETGLSQSELIRRCVFYQLDKAALKSDLLSDWRGAEIAKTWEEVESGLERPKLQCCAILQRRFTDEQERTRRKVKADLPGFKRFADEYVNRFHGGACYDQILEKRSERTFRNVENLIEEFTDYSVDADHSGAFLADLNPSEEKE